MRGEHLGDSVLLGKCLLEVGGGGEVPDLALAFGERLVGDVADQVLEEPVLAALRGARVRLDAEHLLVHQCGEQRLSSAAGVPESAARAPAG